MYLFFDVEDLLTGFLYFFVFFRFWSYDLAQSQLNGYVKSFASAEEKIKEQVTCCAMLVLVYFLKLNYVMSCW